MQRAAWQSWGVAMAAMALLVPGLASGGGSGTGFFVSADGYLVTSEHVVRGAEKIQVMLGEGPKPAEVVASYPKQDLSLLKVEVEGQTFLRLGDSDAVKLGDPVFTIGFPNPEVQGTSAKYTKGDISSLAGIRDDENLFQVSVPIQPGNSGGALVAKDGSVIGVMVSRLDGRKTLMSEGWIPENVNYAVKANHVKPLLGFLPKPSATPEAIENPVANAEAATVMIVTSGPDPVAEVAEEEGAPGEEMSPTEVIGSYVLAYLRAGDSGSPVDQHAFYAPQVKYFGSLLSRDEILEKQRVYDAEWPHRQHEVLEMPEVSRAGRGVFAARVRSRFLVSDGSKHKVVTGTNRFQIGTRREGDAGLIQGVWIEDVEVTYPDERPVLATPSGGYVVVYGGDDGVSFRSKPTVSGLEMGQAVRSEALLVPTGRRSGGWVEVILRGWMSTAGTRTQFLSEMGNGLWRVNRTRDGFLSMRAGPSTSDPLIARVRSGVPVHGVGTKTVGEQTWLYAEVPGWMALRSGSGRVLLERQ